MDLQKIYTDSDFSNTVVPDGQLLLFNAIEDGKPVTRYKDSNGNFGTLSGSGGGSGADVILGQVNSDGNFQAIAFSGTEASNNGDPEVVENYYTYNGVLPVPDGGIHIGGSADYYKCASVDVVNKTWMGYKAVLSDGVYVFENTVTEGLSYGSAFTPELNSIYNADATVKIDKLWNGWLISADGLVFYAPFDKAAATAVTGQTLSQSGEVSFGTVSGIDCMSISGGYLLADTSNLPSGNAPWSISLWMRNTGSFGSNSDAHAVAYGSSNPTQAVFVGLHNNGNIYTSIHSTVDLDSNENAIDSWRHTVVTFSGSTLQLWVDGEKCSEGEASATNIVPNTFKIGGHMSSGGFEFNGSIAAVRVYDHALKEEEIQLLALELTPVA